MCSTRSDSTKFYLGECQREQSDFQNTERFANSEPLIKSNIMAFCGTGIKITDGGISTNYTSPDGGSIVSIVAKYAVNDTCPAGGTTSWDQSRCKFLLNRPLLECEQNGQDIPAPPMYGTSSLLYHAEIYNQLALSDIQTN